MKKWQRREKSLRVFRWELTPQEMEEAVRDFDMFSLDMPDRIVCLKCINKEMEDAYSEDC